MRMLLTAALLVAALPMAAASTDGHATITILPQAATVAHVSGAALDFGTWTASNTYDTTFTLSPNGGSAVGRIDAFTFSKDVNEIVGIHVAPTVTLVGATAGQGTLLVSNLAASAPVIAQNGIDGTFNVGGSLFIPKMTKKGIYAGDYNVTVDYNL